MDQLCLVLWSLAGSMIPAVWAPNLREYRWMINVPLGSVISCAATYGICEWKGIVGFREVNSIAFFSGIVAVALTRNMLDFARSDGLKQWVADRLGIKSTFDPDRHTRPDSDPPL